MNILRYLAWTGLVIIWLAVLLLLQYSFRKKCRTAVHLSAFTIKILLASITAYAVIATDTVFSYRLGFIIAAMYVPLFGDAVGDLLMLPYAVRKKERTAKYQTVACTLCAAAYFLYGTINMQTVTGNRITILSAMPGQMLHTRRAQMTLMRRH